MWKYYMVQCVWRRYIKNNIMTLNHTFNTNSRINTKASPNGTNSQTNCKLQLWFHLIWENYISFTVEHWILMSTIKINTFSRDEILAEWGLCSEQWFLLCPPYMGMYLAQFSQGILDVSAMLYNSCAFPNWIYPRNFPGLVALTKDSQNEPYSYLVFIIIEFRYITWFPLVIAVKVIFKKK